MAVQNEDLTYVVDFVNYLNAQTEETELSFYVEITDVDGGSPGTIEKNSDTGVYQFHTL